MTPRRAQRLAGWEYYSKIGGKIAAKSASRDFVESRCGRNRGGFAARERRRCFGVMRRDGEKDGSDPISTRRHFAERLDGTGKM